MGGAQQDEGNANGAGSEIERQDSSTRRTSLLRSKVLNIEGYEKRGLGMVAEFSFAEKILGNMPAKELGILLSCLLPLVKV